MSSWSLGIILRHGLGDAAIAKGAGPMGYSAVSLPFDLEAACREMDDRYAFKTKVFKECRAQLDAALEEIHERDVDELREQGVDIPDETYD